MSTNNTNTQNIIKTLKPILFKAEVVDFNTLVSDKIKRLPFDREYAICTYPDGLDKPFEIPYIGGEKYSLVENSDILLPLVEILGKKFRNLRVNVSNSDNEVFSVNFYSIIADKIVNDSYSPAITFTNSYNGKKKASAHVSVVYTNVNGETEFLNIGSKKYVFKHHSDSGTIQLASIIASVEEMMTDFSDIETQIEKMKGKKVTPDDILKIVPDSKKYPKKAVSLAVERLGYQCELLDENPNLWLIYTSLSFAIKKLDSELKQWERDDRDALAWENCLSFGNIK